MTLKVDLNADMGESFGPWKMGNDAALLDVVTSANIACGFHAGDPDVMAQTMGLAVEKDVGIGAHPGFADLQGFGRRRLGFGLRLWLGPLALGDLGNRLFRHPHSLGRSAVVIFICPYHIFPNTVSNIAHSSYSKAIPKFGNNLS